MKIFLVFKFITSLFLFALLAGCGLIEGSGKHLAPLSSSIISKMKIIGSSQNEAMLIRLFKEESELEIWKKTKNGTYKLLKTYDICTWAGVLGPKIKEGDRQSPEGFYSVTPGLMNPNSSYYLSFNTGFPNKFDRAHRRTGTNLMVHGSCSSAGCYAMTDEQIAEIYAIGRDSFRGGQKSFQLQLYPFRLTPKNLARHNKSEHIDFWRNLKIGYDAFEISKQKPNWDVCEGKYIFNPAGGKLNALGKCPTNSSRPELMAKVSAKQVSDLEIYKTLVAELEANEDKKVAQAEKREKEKQESAIRTAAVNQAINQQTQGFSTALGGFFGGLFGEQKTITPANIIAPIPHPRLKR